jgi:phospholipid/cholesterol/gamma-HCH transport system ATP-binding protein
MPETCILALSHVNLRYDDLWALRDVCLSLSPGDTRVIYGAAGSGKTTLLKSVLGLVPVDSGEIRLFGQEVTTMRESELFALRSQAGIVFQEGGLFDSLTVGENIGYPLLNQQSRSDGAAQTPDPAEVERRVRDVLRFVELEQTYDKFPSELSGGMRRRVGIARAIVTEPPLVLYDSPTAGLDPITANNIMALIAKERDVRNSASIIVTHRYQDGDIMAEFCYDQSSQELAHITEADKRRKNRTRFLVMRNGEIAFSGTREQLGAATDEYVRRFVTHEE